MQKDELKLHLNPDKLNIDELLKMSRKDYLKQIINDK